MKDRKFHIYLDDEEYGQVLQALIALKNTASPEQIERLQEKIYYGKATRADITRVTKRLGDEIAAVYGFHIPKQRTAMEQAR